MKRIARVVLLIATLTVSACGTKQEETVQEEETVQTEETQSETSTETTAVEENTDKDKPNETADPSEDKTEPVQPEGHWEERTVLVRDAWDEQAVVKEGWTEQIFIKESWTETYEECIEYTQEKTPIYVCRENGKKYYDSGACSMECESSFYNDFEYGETYCSMYETRTVNHPAEYNYIQHEPEYKTVHHEAEYKTETVWVED